MRVCVCVCVCVCNNLFKEGSTVCLVDDSNCWLCVFCSKKLRKSQCTPLFMAAYKMRGEQW